MVDKNKCMTVKEIDKLDELIDERIGSSLPSSELSMLKSIRNKAVNCSSGIAEAPVKKKRAPSAYNVFIGDCMRGGGDTMKNCAIKYKAQKKE